MTIEQLKKIKEKNHDVHFILHLYRILLNYKFIVDKSKV